MKILAFALLSIILSSCGEVEGGNSSSGSGQISSGSGSSSSAQSASSSSVALPDLHYEQMPGFKVSDIIPKNLFDMVMKGESSAHTYPASATWFEAVEFCTKYSALKGVQASLPSELEWELAAQEGKLTRRDDYFEWTSETCFDNAYPQTINCDDTYRIIKGATNPPEYRAANRPDNPENRSIGFRIIF